MALSAGQRTALQGEGLVDVADFEGFDEDTLKQAFKNVRYLNPPVSVPAKCTSRLLIASMAHQYYRETARAITPVNMHFTNVLKSFHLEWKAIQKLAAKDVELKLPVLSKNCPPMKWCESMKLYFDATFGVRNIPLSYVIRESANVTPEVDDPLAPSSSYGSSGSVLSDMISRSSHTHALFKQDNSQVFSLIEQAARNTSYISTIKTFERRKDGRGAWLAMLQAHVTDNKWEIILQENSKWLLNSKWNGKKYALEMFIGQHRIKYEQMKEAAQSVQYQLPNQHTRVGYILNAIESDDPSLHAAMAAVEGDNAIRADFELAAGKLIPKDPYARNQSQKEQKSVSFNISCTDGDKQTETVSKNGRGAKTGVDLRWHTKESYAALSREQRNELAAWKRSSEGMKATEDARAKFNNEKRRRNTKKNSGKDKKKLKAQVASLQKELDEKKSKEDDDAKINRIAAALSQSPTRGNAAAAANGANRNISLAREIMGIVGRESESSA